MSGIFRGRAVVFFRFLLERSVFWDFGSLRRKPRVPYIAMPFVVDSVRFQTGATLRRHFLRAVAAAVFFVRVVAATPWLSCHHTGQFMF